MDAELIAPDDLRWREVLRRTEHDVYHLPEYVRFIAAQDGGKAAAFYVATRDVTLLAPVVLRPVPAELGATPGQVDAVSPYGYASPLVLGTPERAAILDVFAGLSRLAQARGVVCGFFRLHPLLPFPEAVFAEWGELVTHGSTVHVELDAGEQAVRSQIRQGHRYDIQKLRRAGFTVTLNEWERYDDFMAVYWDTMRRVSAGEYYRFTPEYFRDLRATLGNSLNLFSVLAPDGSLAASGLFSAYRRVVQYLFSGTAEKFHRQAPTKLMLEAAIHWARESGYGKFHLGGGVGGDEDALFRFKAGFSHLRSRFHSWRVVFDSPAYRGLVERWALDGGIVPDGSSFFPAYRSPVPRRVGV